MCSLTDTNILYRDPLETPNQIRSMLPITASIKDFIIKSREEIVDILKGMDNRLLMVIGPCSIHDSMGAIEYARQLKILRDEYGEKLYIVMRTYFEKPRTNGGWAGFLPDPYLDGSAGMKKSIPIIRELLLDLAKMGLPTATEYLNTTFYHYIDQLISWAAIGARTAESQPHREMISGMSVPVGIKNSTDGNVQKAIDAVVFASKSRNFLGTDADCKPYDVTTSGNDNLHIIIRGGANGPNYNKKNIEKTIGLMRKAGIDKTIVVDCNHANSNKKPEQQILVLTEIVTQINNGNNALRGVMVESNINAGNQPIESPTTLRPDISITDACISLEETEKLCQYAFDTLKMH